MAHTPGPWIVDYQGRRTAWGQSVENAIVGPDSPVALAVVFAGGDDDRNLIAAAPELLAAAEFALARIASDIEGPERTTAEGEALRAAIAKAKGE